MSLLQAAWQPDPFTATYRALRTGMLASPPFAEAIRLTGNFIDWAGPNFEKLPDALTDQQTPTVILWPDRFTIRPASNSMSVGVTRTYVWQTTTKDLKLATMELVKFAGIIALNALPEDLGLGNLIEGVRVDEGKDDPFGQRDVKLGRSRWLSMIRLAVDMSFPRALLRTLNVPGALT